MSKLEIITLGRDDDYGGEFLKRFKQSVETNLENIKNIDIDYSYLIVDWFPQKKRYLYKNEKLSNIFLQNSVRSLIVDPSIAVSENLNPESFYELFAKNAGVRYTDAEWILILNADIIVPVSLWKEIKRLIAADEGENVFYRARYRTEIILNNDHEPALLMPKRSHTNDFLNHIVDMRKDTNPDDHVGGPFGGDIIMMRKSVFSKYGRAYDETNEGHRSKTLRQATMDSEFLLNLDIHKSKMIQFEMPYIHIFHGHPHRLNRSESAFNPDGYENKDDWGFMKHKKQLIFDNRNDVSIIYYGDLP
jgi:uncharacterized protein YnzC (UPF0291/DUF896 family)